MLTSRAGWHQPPSDGACASTYAAQPRCSPRVVCQSPPQPAPRPHGHSHGRVCACACVVLVARACACVCARVCVCALADDEGEDDFIDDDEDEGFRRRGTGRHHLVLAAALGCTPPLMPTRVQHHLIWPPLLAAASLARGVARIRSRPHPCGNMATLALRRAARAPCATAAHAPLARVQRRDFAQPAAARPPRRRCGTGPRPAGRDRVLARCGDYACKGRGHERRQPNSADRADLMVCAWPAPRCWVGPEFDATMFVFEHLRLSSRCN